MKTVSPGLIAYLASTRQFIKPNLYTFTLVGGQQLFYTDADVPVTTYAAGSSSADSGVLGLGVPGEMVLGAAAGAPVATFLANSVQISGLKYKIAVGVDVDEQDITIAANPTDTVLGVPFLQALRKGVFDGAYLQRDRAFLPAWGAPPIGIVTLFHGRISAVDAIGRTSARIKVKSDLVALDIDFPRNLYQPGCLHALFDSGCGLVKSAFGSSGTVGSGATPSLVPWSGATSGYFDQGTVTFTSGANNGISRNIRQANGTALLLSYPLDTASAAGDGFIAYAGCDHTLATCTTKFNNQPRFRGFPFVPQPELAV